MVAGESGLGKTTFLNTLFNSMLNEHLQPLDLSASKTVEIQPQKYELVEDGVTLVLTIVDTPGFGDQLNRETNFEPIINYIEKQYDDFMAGEKGDVYRNTVPDTRVHSLLYFLPPTGLKRLNDLDIEFLQRICSKVNVIPVIAKADALSPEEVGIFKKTILAEFEKYGIRIYPTSHTTDREFIGEFEKFIPFTVIGSDQLINVDGKMVRGRTYRWGNAIVENPLHCDFIHLRELMIAKNMQDLIDCTHNVHYANYRAAKLGGNGRPPSFLACDEFYESSIEQTKKALAEEIQKKEEQMRQRFVAKVREKEQELREREEKLNATRQSMLEELEALRRAVAEEEASFNDLVASKGKR